MFRDLLPDFLSQKIVTTYDSLHPPEVLCFHDTACPSLISIAPIGRIGAIDFPSMEE